MALAIAFACSVLNKILDLLEPYLTSWAIDSVSGNTPPWIRHLIGAEAQALTLVVFIAVLVVITFGLESLTEWVAKRQFFRLAQQVQHKVRLEAYSKLQDRETAFFENQRTGNLISIMNDDVNQLERFLNTTFNELLQLVVLLVFSALAMLQVSFKMGLVALTPIPLIVLGSFYYRKKIAPIYKEVRLKVGELNNRLENNISGMAVIKSFTAEAFELDRVDQASKAYRDANYKAIGWSTAYTPVLRLFIALGLGAVLGLGAYWILQGDTTFTLGHLAFFAMMLQRLLWPITGLGRIFDDYERSMAAARRIFQILDSETTIKNPATPVEPLAIEGTWSIRDLSFTYSKGAEKVLQHLDLQIPARSTIGIAGPTGAGKSTLIKLLLRLYDPTQGNIELDGVNLKDWNLQHLRKQIALVSQDTYLFHGTIAENIAYGIPDASREAILQAARQAALHDFIHQLPLGYETLVGERGIKLSGGQRQRLSLARAILKNAPILLLDEATSAVDTQTEQAIQDNLQALCAGKTAIIIAHRLSTLRLADTIYVLDAGKVVEQGSHESLIARKGKYALLWELQTGKPD